MNSFLTFLSAQIGKTRLDRRHHFAIFERQGTAKYPSAQACIFHSPLSIADFNGTENRTPMPLNRTHRRAGQAKVIAGLPFWRINPNRPQCLQVDRQLFIDLPPNPFCRSTGEVVTQPVRLEVGRMEHIRDLIFNGLPTLYQGHLFDCWAQFALQAWQGTELLQLRRPIHLAWQLKGRQLTQPLQLLGNATAEPPVKAAAPGGSHWKVYPQARLRAEQTGGSLELALTIPATGVWMVGAARICRLAAGLFSLRPQDLPGSCTESGAILLFDHCNGYTPLEPTPRGFTGWRLPAFHPGRALVWAKYEQQWVGGMANFCVGEQNLVRVPMQLQRAQRSREALFAELLR